MTDKPRPPLSHSTAPTKVGTYSVIKLLGQGGMGSVFLGFHAELRRHVAIKVLPANADKDLVDRFHREARAVARLRHKGIVAVHDVGEENGRQFFTMDFIEGGTLHDLLSKTRLPILKSFEIMRKVVDALDFAHQQGVVHRDIKPHNIMIDSNGDPLLADFGLARMTDDVTLSRSGLMVGTPAYMSPEQAGGNISEIDPRSDLWSIGATLYQMLAHTLPFPGNSTIEILMKVTHEEPQPLRVKNAAIPRDAEAIVFKCLAKSPEDRYASAAALRDDIDRFLTGQPVFARPVTRVRRTMAWIRRNRALSGTAAIGGFGIAITLAYFLWLGPAVKASSRAAHLRNLEQLAATACRDRMKIFDAALASKTGLDELISEAREVPGRVRKTLAPKDPEEAAAVDRGLASYAPGPVLSRAHYLKQKWALAYRTDPSGRWGLKAQVEIARQFVKDLRLDEAALTLRRIRSRFPDSEAAKDSLTLLGDVLSQQGNLDGALAAYLESGTRSDRVDLIESILGEKFSIPVSGNGVTADFGPLQEPFILFQADGPSLLCPYRVGRPAFRITSSGLVPISSPLSVLPASDQVADVCDADFDGDGKKELICAVYRQGVGGGYAVIGRTGDTWKLSHIDLSNASNATAVAAGDMDGDGRDEAFVLFMWRSSHQWFVRRTETFVVSPLALGGPRPWALSVCMSDLDGDGKCEALIGRSGEERNAVEVYAIKDRKLNVTTRYPVGDAGYIAPLGRGLIGVITDARYQPRSGEDDALVLMRAVSGRLDQVALHSYSFGDAGSTGMGPVSSGRLAGKDVIMFSTSRGATDLLGKRPEGFRLRIIHGDPESEPIALATPWTWLSATRLFDLEGDGESELFVLSSDKILIQGRRKGAPPKLPPVDPESEPPGEPARLLRAADDLIGFESFTEGRDLLLEIADRFPDRPEASEARRLRCDALLRSANLDFAIATRHSTAENGLAAGTTAVEKCLAAAKEARADAARFSSQPAIRRRFLLLAAEASRLAGDIEGQRDDLKAALECARSFDDAAMAGTVSLLGKLIASRPVLTGDPAGESQPFVTDCPSRVRRHQGTLEAVLDSHSEWFVAGIPVTTGGGGISITMDFELESSVWSAGVYLGLLPMESQPPQPMWGSLRMMLHGTTSWDTQGAQFSLVHGPSVHLEQYRGRWKMAWSYLPETGLQSLEIRTLEGVPVYRGRWTSVPSAERAMVFGIGMGYEGGDALLTHGLHPPTARIRIGNVVLSSHEAHVDAGVRTTPRAFELAAGGQYFRGNFEAAAALYRKAIERDGRLIRARLFLAMATDDPGPIAEAFRIDPYVTVCSIDDTMRGADPVHLRRMGALLQKLRDQDPPMLKAACLSFLGEWEEAGAALKAMEPGVVRQYLIRRTEVGDTKTLAEAWDWLTSRQMRTAGLGFPTIIWAPGPGESKETARAELDGLGRIRTEELRRAWVTIGRWLLLEPEDVAVLKLRADIALAFQQHGRAEQDYLKIAELRPRDPAAHFMAARHYARRTATKETLEFLRKAVETGFRESAAFDDAAFKFLQGNDEFKALRNRVGM